MARLRWWIHQNSAGVSYLLIVGIVFGLLTLALTSGGHW